MGELKNLAGMFSSVEKLLQERDAELVEKISRLEARLEELEGRLKEMGASGAAVAAAAVDGIAVTAAAAEIEDEIVAGVEGEVRQDAVNDSEEDVVGNKGMEIADEVCSDAVNDAEEDVVAEEDAADDDARNGAADTVDGTDDAGVDAEDRHLDGNPEILEQPEIEIEFEFDDEPESEVLEPEEQDVVELEPEEQEFEEPEPQGLDPVTEPEGFGMEEAGGVELVMDKARPDWYDWEVDIPGPYIEDIRDGIGLNDRILFLNDLFYGNEEAFASAISELNGMDRLVEAVEYIRERYPQWDEESDEVYRFYMIVRRRFNKQIQER